MKISNEIWDMNVIFEKKSNKAITKSGFFFVDLATPMPFCEISAADITN